MPFDQCVNNSSAFFFAECGVFGALSGWTTHRLKAFRASSPMPAARNLLLEGGPWSSRGAGPEGGEMGVGC